MDVTAVPEFETHFEVVQTLKKPRATCRPRSRVRHGVTGSVHTRAT